VAAAPLAAPRRAFGARRTGDRTRRRRVDGRRDRPRDRSFVVVVRRSSSSSAREARERDAGCGVVAAAKGNFFPNVTQPNARRVRSVTSSRASTARAGGGDVEREQSVVARLQGAVA
jgi:hypothetical protein